MNPPLVRIVRTRLSWYVNRWVPLDETRQLSSFGTHVANLKQKIPSQRPLYVQVPVLGVGQGQVRCQRQVSQRCGKRAGRRRVAVVRVGKIKRLGGPKADLLGLQIRRRADR